MKNISIALSTLFLCASASAAFSSHNWTDDMTDTKAYSKYTSVKSSGYNNYATFGFECRVNEGKQSRRMSIEVSDDNGFATPNADLLVKVRVDKGQIYSLKGHTYSNSYRSAFINDVPDELYTELKSGNKVVVNIYKYDQLKSQNTFSLSGSSKAIDYVSNKCGVERGISDEIVLQKKEINDFYDKEIAKLEAERKAKLAAVK